MKILYVDTPIADYGSAMLWEGFCRVLGVENVIDYPINPIFHDNSPWDYITTRNVHPFDKESDIWDIMSSFDFLCLASTNQINIKTIRTWQDNNVSLPPIVLVDQSEERELSMFLVDEFRPCCIFKREYILNREYPDNCYPLPFSSPYKLVEDIGERPIDVCCMMADNYPSRRWLDWLLGQLGLSSAIIYEGSFHRPIDRVQYMNKLRQAKIGIAVRGFGFDTNRFLEVIASHCLLLSDELALVKPHPFIDKKHCVYYHEGNIAWLIRHYLTANDERARIANAGFEHLKKYHTVEARAQYVLDIVKGYL